jgi:hypothetical protein
MNINFFYSLFTWLLLTILPEIVFSQSMDFTIQNVKFESDGVTLAGSILTPRKK